MEIKHYRQVGGEMYAMVGSPDGDDIYIKKATHQSALAAKDAEISRLKGEVEKNDKVYSSLLNDYGNTLNDVENLRNHLGEYKDKYLVERRRAEIAEAKLKEVEGERDKYKADVFEMVQKAADQHLEGYRELGRKAADAENKCEALEQQNAELRKVITKVYEEQFCYCEESMLNFGSLSKENLRWAILELWGAIKKVAEDPTPITLSETEVGDE